MNELIKNKAKNPTDKLVSSTPFKGLNERQLKEMNLILSWLNTSSKGDPKSENTKKNYRRDIKYFMGCYPHKLLKEIETPDIAAYMEQLIEGGLETATYNRTLAAIRSLFDFLMRAQYIDKNPALLINFKRVRDKTAERLIFPDQVRRMLELEPQPRNRLMIYLLYKVGARCEEITKIQRQHLVEREGRAYLILIGKGNKTRMILIDQKLHKQILEQFSHQEEQNPKRFKNKARNAYLFQSQKSGGRLSTTQIYRVVKAAGLRAGLSPKISPHWLRHGHATEARRQGADLRQIQMQLGHSSIQTTEKYTHVMAEDSTTQLVDI